MFEQYKSRPDTVRAIVVTEDNVDEVARYIGEEISRDGHVKIVLPGTSGAGRPRLSFSAQQTPSFGGFVVVPIPGVLISYDTPEGVRYHSQETEEFTAGWELATSYRPHEIVPADEETAYELAAYVEAPDQEDCEGWANGCSCPASDETNQAVEDRAARD